MRIFLTGASGYIGLHIVRELLMNGHEVTAVARTAQSLSHFLHAPNLRVVEADLAQVGLALRTLKGHQVCVHAALLWGDPGEELELRDTVFAAKLFAAAGQAGIERCIFISSVSVHRPFTGQMNEGTCLSATDYYGATKAAGELFLRAACLQYSMVGVVIRPGPAVGSPAFPAASFRTDRRLAAMVAAATEVRPLAVIDGDGRQFSDVVAVAKAVRMLTWMENPHPTYICVDQAILTWEWIARKVAACLNSQSEVIVRPSPSGERPLPRFCTARIDKLLGAPIDSRSALEAHILHEAQSVHSLRHPF